MPVYEYSALNAEKSCSVCRDGFEVEQSMDESPLAVCPSCGNTVQKLISVPFIPRKTVLDSQLLTDNNLKKNGFHKLVKDKKKGGYKPLY